MDVFNTGNIREHINIHFFITHNQPAPFHNSFPFPFPIGPKYISELANVNSLTAHTRTHTLLYLIALSCRCRPLTLLYLEAIREGEDLQHLKQRCLGCPHFLVNFDQVDLAEDFNGTPGNLSGNGESLEEGCLLWSQPGVLWIDEYIPWSKGSGFSWSFHLVCGGVSVCASVCVSVRVCIHTYYIYRTKHERGVKNGCDQKEGSLWMRSTREISENT